MRINNDFLRIKQMKIEPIAIIHNDFTDKFAIPRQSGIAQRIKSRIEFLPPYSDLSAIKGIEGFSHLWLIWQFSENIRDKHDLTVRPPRLGGNKKVGVFASRSPYRPNNLGLSSVRLDDVLIENDKPVLIVSGADIMNKTPIYDIKPYIPFSDCHEDANGGYIDENDFNILEVNADEKLLSVFSDEQREVLLSVLSNDPRPAYHRDSKRIYGFSFAHREIKFKVENNIISVVSVDEE